MMPSIQPFQRACEVTLNGAIDSMLREPRSTVTSSSTTLNMQKLGRNIKALRKAAGLTQAQLAEMIGLERTSVTNMENGNQRVAVDTLQAIAEATGYRLEVKFVGPISFAVRL